MEVKFRSLTYDEARVEHFEALKNKAERKMIYWAARSDRSTPNNLADPACIKASEFGKEYNYYKDALEALAAAPKWISVEERLPEELEDVLVFSRNGSCTWAEVAHLMRNQWWRVGIPMINVTHWMPLPESPEEDA